MAITTLEIHKMCMDLKNEFEAPLMKCKKALIKSEYDFQKAREYLRLNPQNERTMLITRARKGDIDGR